MKSPKENKQIDGGKELWKRGRAVLCSLYTGNSVNTLRCRKQNVRWPP